MATLYTPASNNPALHQEPLSQQARVIPPRDKESLLNWLESTGRFEARDSDVMTEDKVAEDLEDIIEPSYSLDKEEDDDDSWDMED
ncbi:hypothetical protein C7B76_02110 [filamentous cyanobacterium CCP2]|nr:hypothetical protein C7B76_02110 [filamentous cyanobacterium CCP2]